MGLLKRAKGLVISFTSQPVILLPALIMLLATAPMINFGMPNYEDPFSESYEPLKTFKFLISHGQELHKWGALQNFLYAPWYVAMMAYWKWTGAFGPPSRKYPYGLHDGIRQLGVLIVGARAINLLVMSIALTIATAGAAALIRSGRWAAVAVGAVVVCTPEYLKLCPDTNPEGTMLACMLAATGFYLMMLARGPTRRTAIVCGAMCALAMSCKEQAIPAAAAVSIGMIAVTWPRRSTDAAMERLDICSMLPTLAYFAAGIILTYLAVNVVYAPRAWVNRLHFITTSGYMDPNVWSPGTGAFHWGRYILDTIRAVAVSLGLGGIAAVALAAMLTPRWRAREIAAGWLPVVTFIGMVFVKAGYMSIAFMSIAGILAVIPVTLAFRSVQAAGSWRRVAFVGTLLLSPLLLIGATGPWQAMPMSTYSMVSDYLDHHCRNGEHFHMANLWQLPDGGERERLRGLKPDARPLGVALADPTSPPDLIIISANGEEFLDEFAQNSKRAKMFSEESGVDYTGFHGFRAAGYQLVDTVNAPRFDPPEISWLLPFLEQNTIQIYRRVGGRSATTSTAW
jgi:hypothetical protein